MSDDGPVVASTAPIAVELAAGQSVWWCACGRSRNQPFCDGSHAGTGFTPIEFTAGKARTYFFCACKHSGKAPICDGSHNRV